MVLRAGLKYMSLSYKSSNAVKYTILAKYIAEGHYISLSKNLIK